ncbi:N-acyl-D-amino-acid deacylase family protein [Desulfosudis oleivorans]|uniref:D-aminoacylase domain protein n=1 Tax=Desulfosudis oleivorans (strain DSM 6200 / JCM 39069 / Hxd3) TaxID=96561 RepID=A8ZSG7_DESOH|nr:amidohydrolase family protein [Desulfosudis oleivorans]ABW67704.1 D-aminoacylase domain protein [Desulfosudis oleivorans Hxd3]
MRLDTVLENALVVDGSGEKPYPADVGIQGSAIAAIGDLSGCEAGRRKDVSGRVVCPGFIDVHSHADLAFFRSDHDVMLTPLVEQGITTFVGGNCGMALAPITEANREGIKTYLEVFTQMDFERDVQWDTMGSYMDHMDKTGVLLNSAQLAPHGVMRISALGLSDKPADDKAIAFMRKLLEESLEAGAFGLSTGLQYAPGLHSDTRELSLVSKPLSAYDAVFTSHLRSYTSNCLNKAIDEVARVAGDNNIRGQISHIFSVPWTGPVFHPLALKVIKWLARRDRAAVQWIPDALLDAEMNRILKKVKTVRQAGIGMGMDMMPTTTGFTHLLAFFPPWALSGDRQAVLERLRNRDTRQEIRKDIEQGRPIWPHRGKNTWSLNLIRQMGWDALIVMAVNSEKNKPLEGRRFTEIAAEQGKHPFDVMCDLLLEEDGQVLAFETMSDPDDLFTERYTFPGLKDPDTMISTDTILLGMGRPSYLFYGCYPKFINRYVYQLNLLDLPTAVAKCTSIPAEHFGIRYRGVVKEGNYADLLVIDAENFRTRASFADPRHAAEGLDMVFINGCQVVENGTRIRQTLSGMMLRKNSQPAPTA